MKTKLITKTNLENNNNSFFIIKSNENLIIEPPNVIEITLHNVCNYKCKMCYFWKNHHKEFFPYDTLKKTIKEISKFKGKNPQIQFIGGGTLMYPKIENIIEYATNLGLETQIITNGYFLGKNMVLKLSNAGLNHITISLDSIEKEAHNFVRGIDCFDKIMEGIEYLSKYAPNISVSINTIISSINLHSITEIAQFAKNNKAIEKIFFIILDRPINSEFIHNWKEFSPVSYLWPKNKHMINEAINKLIEEKKVNKKISNSVSQLEIYRKYYHNISGSINISSCNFGNIHFRINQVGDAYLCSIRDDLDSIGNVEKFDVVDIWQSKKAQNHRKKMFSCNQKCIQVLCCNFEEENIK
ncbi:radical SAM protein [archaeon]|nr:radical SAM protein [archaeon]